MSQLIPAVFHKYYWVLHNKYDSDKDIAVY